MVRVVLVAGTLAACGAAFQDKASLIQGTSGSKVGAWEVQTGGLVLREGAVGSAFGTVRKGGAAHELSYFVLLKHRYTAASSAGSTEESGAADAQADTKQVVDVDGTKLTVSYKIEFNAKANRVLGESLTVNGKALDVAKGRVLLVDLTVSPPKWEQKKLTLPATVPAATDRKAAAALARQTLEALAKQDKAVQAFITAAGGR
jgi:hypothetical protein